MNRRGFLKGVGLAGVAAVTAGSALATEGRELMRVDQPQKLRIYDHDPGDYIEMRHDGTDFNLSYSGTTRIEMVER